MLLIILRDLMLTYIFMQPISFSAVAIVPTKAQKRECSWDPNYYSPILYFATMDDAKRYVDSIG